MNEANDELDDAIANELLNALRQLQVRPEWAARVLRDLAIELARESQVERTAIGGIRSHGSWRWVRALAAGFLLAVLFGSWR